MQPRPIGLKALAVGLAVRRRDPAARTAHDPVLGIELEAADRDHGLGWALPLGRHDGVDAALLEAGKHAGDGVRPSIVAVWIAAPVTAGITSSGASTATVS